MRGILLWKIYQELLEIRKTLQDIQSDLKCFPKEKNYSVHVSKTNTNNLVKKNI